MAHRTRRARTGCSHRGVVAFLAAPCGVVGGAEACMRGGRGRGLGRVDARGCGVGPIWGVCQQQALTGTESKDGLWGRRGVAHRHRRASVDDRRLHSRRGGDRGTGSRKQRNRRTAPILPSGILRARQAAICGRAGWQRGGRSDGAFDSPRLARGSGNRVRTATRAAGCGLDERLRRAWARSGGARGASKLAVDRVEHAGGTRLSL